MYIKIKKINYYNYDLNFTHIHLIHIFKHLYKINDICKYIFRKINIVYDNISEIILICELK